MPLLATCTIENAILALCAPPGAMTFSSWVCAVPLRFDTLASSRLARRIPGVCCRALRVSLRVQCWRFCVPAGLRHPSAGLRRAWQQIWRVRAAARVAAQLRPCSATATVPAYLAGAVGQTVHADHFDGLDRALAARHGSTGAARRWHSGCASNRFPDGLRHVCAVTARQRAALRLAAAIIHGAHDCIANP